MKTTPEQWLKKYDFMGGEYDTPARFVPIIEAIQDDAEKPYIEALQFIAAQSCEGRLPEESPCYKIGCLSCYAAGVLKSMEVANESLP
jgi:hypothetical protein